MRILHGAPKQAPETTPRGLALIEWLETELGDRARAQMMRYGHSAIEAGHAWNTYLIQIWEEGDGAEAFVDQEAAANQAFAFAFAVARRASEMRGRRFSGVHWLEEVEDAPEPIVFEMERSDLPEPTGWRRDLAAAYRALSKPQAEAVDLTYIAGMTCEQAGAASGRTAESIRSARRKAERSLRKRVEELTGGLTLAEWMRGPDRSLEQRIVLGLQGVSWGQRDALVGMKVLELPDHEVARWGTRRPQDIRRLARKGLQCLAARTSCTREELELALPELKGPEHLKAVLALSSSFLGRAAASLGLVEGAQSASPLAVVEPERADAYCPGGPGGPPHPEGAALTVSSRVVPAAGAEGGSRRGVGDTRHEHGFWRAEA